MSGRQGRKQNLNHRVADSNFELDWSNLEEKGRQKQREKPNFPSNSSLTMPVKRVKPTHEKGKHYPMDRAHTVPIVGSQLTFENLVDGVWKFFVEKDGDVSPHTHAMTMLANDIGPDILPNFDMKKVKIVFVYFQKKVHARHLPPGRVNHHAQSVHPTVKPSRSINQVGGQEEQEAEQPPAKIQKSVMRSFSFTIPPSKLMQLGKKVENEIRWEEAKVKKLLFNDADSEFAWDGGHNVRIHLGDKIEEGGFRVAMKCKVMGLQYQHDGLFVFKKIKPEKVEEIRMGYKSIKVEKTTTQVEMELNCKAVQNQVLAGAVANAFGVKLGLPYQDSLRYVGLYLIEYEGGVGTIEEYLNGKFMKYMNNTMEQKKENGYNSDLHQKIYALAHYSYHYSGGKYLVTDMQGVENILTDPEVASEDSLSLPEGDEPNEIPEMLFGPGNIKEAINTFQATHGCNKYCKMAGLSPFPDVFNLH